MAGGNRRKPAEETVWDTAGTSYHPHLRTQAGTACLVTVEQISKSNISKHSHCQTKNTQRLYRTANS